MKKGITMKITKLTVYAASLMVMTSWLHAGISEIIESTAEKGKSLVSPKKEIEISAPLAGTFKKEEGTAASILKQISTSTDDAALANYSKQLSEAQEETEASLNSAISDLNRLNSRVATGSIKLTAKDLEAERMALQQKQSALSAENLKLQNYINAVEKRKSELAIKGAPEEAVDNATAMASIKKFARSVQKTLSDAKAQADQKIKTMQESINQKIKQARSIEANPELTKIGTDRIAGLQKLAKANEALIPLQALEKEIELLQLDKSNLELIQELERRNPNLKKQIAAAQADVDAANKSLNVNTDEYMKATSSAEVSTGAFPPRN